MIQNFLPNLLSKLKNPIWLLLPILLVGSLLRFWHLGTWSFWSDEVLTVLDAQQLSMADFRINPIPYLAVKFSMWVGGTGEWGARFIPCLTGIASIPLIFLMGRSLFNTRVGLFAASFLALSSWHLFWSQNARSYVFT
ncbi:glycosyltransferase family 39 protein, partial [Candidatus Poribacteria bacterium]|nr:glycosyltransferase family 39 protein [Candidatus Poribacteria bacterium]